MRSRHVQRMQARAQLLGPDGKPVQKADVFFIQWLPDGTSTGRTIERSPEIAALAKRFMDKGGRYAFVAGTDDKGQSKGELVAGFTLDDSAKGEMLAIADEAVANGPEIGNAIDRLVRASVANMGKYTLTDEPAGSTP